MLLPVSACGQRNQDRLDDDNRSGTHQSARATPSERCASKSAYELVKRELFRRAAQTRGEEDPTFEPVVAGSTLSLDRAAAQGVDDELGSINCTATASLSLPQGMVAAGGRNSLAADISYVLQPAADQSGDVATLTNAERITVPLATIARSGGAPGAPTQQTAAADVTSPPQVSDVPPTGRTSPSAQVPASPVRRPPVVASPARQVEPPRPIATAPAPPVRTARPRPPAAPARRPDVVAGGSGWRLVRTLDEGPLNTRIYLEQQSVSDSGDGRVRVRAKYVGTLKGQAPVQTFTDETVECDTAFHTQHSYVVRNASGRIVSQRGAQPRKKILPNTMLRGLLGTICS